MIVTWPLSYCVSWRPCMCIFREFENMFGQWERSTTMVLWNTMFFSHTYGVLCIYSGGGVVCAWEIEDRSSCTYGDRGELQCKFHSAVHKHIWTAIGSYFLYLQDVLLLKPCICATSVIWMWEVVAIRTAVPPDALFLVRRIWVTGGVDIFCHDIDINKHGMLKDLWLWVCVCVGRGDVCLCA